MPIWRGNVFLNSLGPLAGSENYSDKDRWAGEKHTYLFKFHRTWEPPQGHEHPKKQTRVLWCWVWWRVGSCGGWRGSGRMSDVVTGGLAGSTFWDSSWVPLCLEMQVFFSSGFRESTSHLRVLWPASGRIVGEGQRDLHASAMFSNSISLKYSICPGTIFWGIMFWTPSPVTM